ncbi:MAG: cyclase family protein [Saprospiraceae bacterium]|nr:cyclase family protein [Saprospiraceae bacterium]
MLFNPSAYDIIDLTMSYHVRMDGYAEEQSRTLEDDGWNAKQLHIYSHAGTHMDAPLHFGVSKVTIDQLPATNFFTEAWLVDVPIVKDQQLINVSDVSSVSHQIRPGQSILMRTGWSKTVGSERYRNKLPRISTSLAKWCVDKKVNVLGVEPPSVADVNNLPEVTEVHKILLGGNVTIVEGLTNLDHIIDPKVLLVALPLKIKDGDGAPARVFALQQKRS